MPAGQGRRDGGGVSDWLPPLTSNHAVAENTLPRNRLLKLSRRLKVKPPAASAPVFYVEHARCPPVFWAFQPPPPSLLPPYPWPDQAPARVLGSGVPVGELGALRARWLRVLLRAGDHRHVNQVNEDRRGEPGALVNHREGGKGGACLAAQARCASLLFFFC